MKKVDAEIFDLLINSTVVFTTDICLRSNNIINCQLSIYCLNSCADSLFVKIVLLWVQSMGN